jgi:hypothetical protein
MTPLPTEIDRIIEKRTTNEQLVAFMSDPENNPLKSAKLEEKLKRINVADNLIQHHGSRERVLQMLQFKFDYSRSSAIRDYKDAKSVFGSLSFNHKGYERAFWYESVKAQALKAAEEKDFKAYERLAALAFKLAEFDKEEIDLPQEDLTPHQFIFTDDPTILGIERLPNLEERKKRLWAKQKREEMGFEDVEEAEVMSEDEN